MDQGSKAKDKTAEILPDQLGQGTLISAHRISSTLASRGDSIFTESAGIKDV